MTNQSTRLLAVLILGMVGGGLLTWGFDGLIQTVEHVRVEEDKVSAALRTLEAEGFEWTLRRWSHGDPYYIDAELRTRGREKAISFSARGQSAAEAVDRLLRLIGSDNCKACAKGLTP